MWLARLAQVINLRPFPIFIESTHFFTMLSCCVPCLSDPNQQKAYIIYLSSEAPSGLYLALLFILYSLDHIIRLVMILNG
jgi:hypothetical protein